MIPKPTTFMCLCGMFQFQEQASLWSQLLKFVIMLHNNFTHGERLCVGGVGGRGDPLGQISPIASEHRHQCNFRLPAQLLTYCSKPQVHAQCVPEGVGSAHPADQVADFGARLGSVWSKF